MPVTHRTPSANALALAGVVSGLHIFYNKWTSPSRPHGCPNFLSASDTPDNPLGNPQAVIIQETPERVQDKSATTAGCILPPTDDSGALLSTREAYSDIL